jgi:ATP-dependent exoDNAse (exonuclease V) beta subunit
MNLLYVGLTRAKEALFVPLVYQPPSKKPQPSEFKKFRDFSEIIANSPLVLEKSESTHTPKGTGAWYEYSFGELQPRDAVSKKDIQTSEFLSPRSKHLSTSAWKNEFLIFSPSVHYSDKEQKAITRGEAIHRVLARVGTFKSRDEISAVLKPLVEAEDLPEEELHLLSGFLKQEAVFPFFCGDIEVRNELEVAGMVNGQMEYRRLDRLVIKGNDVFVLDFKTGFQKKEGYRDQIKEYLNIMEPFFPDKRCRGNLLFVDTGEVEEVL